MSETRLKLPPLHPGGLQINEDLDLQRRAWAVERIGWAVMAAVVVAALLGFFGPGPLSAPSRKYGDVRERPHPASRAACSLAWRCHAALRRDAATRAQIVRSASPYLRSGALSHATAASPDGSLRVNYLRFTRMGGTTTMQVEISGPAVQQPELRLRVGQQLLDSVQVQQIIPQPNEVQR